MYKINTERLLNSFFKILSINSFSKKEKEFSEYIKSEFDKLGLITNIDEAGKTIGGSTGNLIAKFTPEYIKNNQPVFLSAHMDTVFAENPINPYLTENNLIQNKNPKTILGADDKAAIAAMVEAVNVIKEYKLGTKIFYIILTVAEEIGLLGSKNIDLTGIDADIGFVFDADGPVGTIINKAPYHNRLDLKITGKASHAGVNPEKGINSIKAAALALAQIPSGRIDKDTTCNVGIIKGGTQTNIVPEITTVNIEIRSMDEKKLEKITGQIVASFKIAAADYKAKLEYKIYREYNGYKIGVNNHAVKIAKKALKNISIIPRMQPSGGGSDTNNFNSKNKIAINLSSGFENCHSADEYIPLEELEKLTKLIIEICIL